MPRNRLAPIVLALLAVAFLPFRAPAQNFDSAPARAALEELAGSHIAGQIHFSALPAHGPGDSFHISGAPGSIQIAGTSNVALLTGFQWYLRYVAHGEISTNGIQLALPSTLPAPSAPIEIRTEYPLRYAFNENVSGYSTPYWRLPRWKHEIDIMAASGANALLIQRGTMMVLYKTFRDFGYTDQEIRSWLTQPARMNWQLMGNMCCFGGPISMQLLEARTRSAQQVLGYLRGLGITPVLPGYYGVIPPGFAKKNPGAHVIPQGEWNAMPRPDWLDPRDPLFAKVAADFYRHQRELFGDTSIYSMEVFQEGGTPGDVPVGAGSVAIQQSLEKAHPGAYWMMLAWGGNPRPELIQAVDRSRILIADEDLNIKPEHNPETEYKGAPYLYNAIWDFGGHNTIGAHLQSFAKRIPEFGGAPGSHMRGISFYNEGLDTDPAAFEFFMEMAWHQQPVDVQQWFSNYALRRYGRRDPHAERAWHILAATAYHISPRQEDAQNSLFNLRPGLVPDPSWGMKKLVYDPAEFERALPELLAVSPALRGSETYQYDLVNLTRQTLDNRAYSLLPQIKAAYEAHDRKRFASLTGRWLHWMKMEDALLQTNHWFLLGPWVAATRPWAANPAEERALAYDARSLLTTWGDRAASVELRDYANKDWSGMVGDLYYQRWKLYFESLDAALKTGTEPKPIDWYAVDDAWNRKQTALPLSPSGDAYAEASAIYRQLKAHPADWSTVDYPR